MPQKEIAVRLAKEVDTMKRIWVSLIAVLVGLSVAGLADAGNQSFPPRSDKPVAMEQRSESAREAMGEVVKADPAKMTLVIKAAGKQLNFSVAEQAVSTLLTLKPGDKVMVQYTEVNGKRTVQDIKKG
jgi:Cu/Ag efflux protein CusF